MPHITKRSYHFSIYSIYANALSRLLVKDKEPFTHIKNQKEKKNIENLKSAPFCTIRVFCVFSIAHYVCFCFFSWLSFVVVFLSLVVDEFVVFFSFSYFLTCESDCISGSFFYNFGHHTASTYIYKHLHIELIHADLLHSLVQFTHLFLYQFHSSFWTIFSLFALSLFSNAYFSFLTVCVMRTYACCCSCTFFHLPFLPAVYLYLHTVH